MKNILKNKYLKPSLLLLAGLFLGWLLFHTSSPNGDKKKEKTSEKSTIWTCAMHPQIRMDHAGQCPICGMDLIPLVQSTSNINPNAVLMTPEAVQMANVQTTVVSRHNPSREVRLYGKIEADERLVQTQSAHVPGRIEQLSVNFTGDAVAKGQTIATIYSPELVTAEKELLEAIKLKSTYPAYAEAAREKLRQWKLTDAQIASIESSGTTRDRFEVKSNASGVVMVKRVNVGDYVSQGATIYEIADLSRVWAMFDAYESDLPWLKVGDKIVFTAESSPGKEFTGSISFIDPVMNQDTRVTQVRVEVNNSNGLLKPGMFVTGNVRSVIHVSKDYLVIPQSAVLWTGTRSIVYVKVPNTKEPAFLMREITLGPSVGYGYIVTDGLKEGEEIVTHGAFSVDASAQLAGKPSMMNERGDSAAAEHGHGQANINPWPPEANQFGELPAPDARFKKQLTVVYEQYLDMKNAFIASDPKLTAENAGKVKALLSKADLALLSGKNLQLWKDQAKSLQKAIEKIAKEQDIERQREAFASFNLVFYKTIKAFGLEGAKAYYQYCPMAIGNKGAYWFSDSKVIRNPYFGAKMIGCGENRDTLR